MPSKYPGNVTYKDTKGCGALTVRGFELHTDPDGYIEAPADVAAEIAPHGFIREDRPTAARREAKHKGG